jgi:hypothetical protein
MLLGNNLKLRILRKYPCSHNAKHRDMVARHVSDDLFYFVIENTFIPSAVTINRISICIRAVV